MEQHLLRPHLFLSLLVSCTIFQVCHAGGGIIIDGDQPNQKLALEPLKSDDGGRSFYIDQVQIGPKNSTSRARLLLDTSTRKHLILNFSGPPLEGEDPDYSRASSSRQKFGNGWDFRGRQVTTIMRLAGLTFRRSQVMLAKDVDLMGFEFPHDGIFSIGEMYAGHKTSHLDPDNDDKSNPVARRVKRQIISLYLKPYKLTETSNETAAGVLAFGFPSRRFYKGELYYVSYKTFDRSDHVVTSYFQDRYLPMKSIEVQYSPLESAPHWPWKIFRYKTSMVETLFDSSSPFIMGDPEVTDRFHIDLIGAEKFLGSYYLFKDCRLDDKPNFIFTIGLHDQEPTEEEPPHHRLVLKPEDYVVQLDDNIMSQLNQHQRLDGRCVSAIRAIPPHVAHKKLWSFGTVAMKKLYLVFDQDDMRVGLAEAL